MIEVHRVHKGDLVRFEGGQGVVLAVDHDEYELTVDFAPDQVGVDGVMQVSVDEPDLELVPNDQRR